MKKQGFLIALGCTCMIAVSTFVACNEKEENECVNRSLNKKLLEESSDITGTFTLMNGKVEYDLYVLNGRLISSTNVSTGNVYKTKQIVEMMMDSIPEEELMQLFKEIEQTEDGDE